MRDSRGQAQAQMVRIGDAEREACVSDLIDHHVHGRLAIDELDRRQKSAFEAKTEGDLRDLLSDLPQGAARRGPRRAAQARGLSAGSADRSVAGVLVPTAVVLGSASFSQYWFMNLHDGPFLSAALGAGLGYGAHAAFSRFRR